MFFSNSLTFRFFIYKNLPHFYNEVTKFYAIVAVFNSASKDYFYQETTTNTVF